MHDYDNYKRLYLPAVAVSRTRARTQSRQEFQMTWQRRVLFVNAAMQGHYPAHEVRVDSRRGYSVVDTMEVRQIDGYGSANQHFLPPDTGSGFIWRIRSVSRYEQRDGGVILALEAIALTRDIPASLSWLVAPLVYHLSINSPDDHPATDPQCRERSTRQRRAAGVLPDSRRRGYDGEGAR
jgi:hypothetical protein